MTSSFGTPSTFYPFRPDLHGPFAQRFLQAAERIGSGQGPHGSFESHVRDEVDWALSIDVNPPQRRLYRAIWLLLRDLLRIGWQPRWTGEHLELAPPMPDPPVQDAEQLAALKERVRAAMRPGRLDRLADARDFVIKMENPSANGLAKTSVLDLLADGRELAADLQAASELHIEERSAALAECIKPYLQLVSENERCTHTGHRLGDIWRYLRLTWASPAENTPGRTLLYLVRDAARPLHPIIGIGSLENAPLRLAARDDFLGWTKEAFRSELVGAEDDKARRDLFLGLLEGISEAISETDIRDLCDASELQRPTDELLRRLASISAHSAAEREQAVARWRSSPPMEEERSELGNISAEVEEHLYRRKRADQLGRLLSARQQILDLTERPSFASDWMRFSNSESGSSAIWAALVARKNRYVGTSILELNVCGALPPYNEILGGKLVALLMLSPQVVEDYRARYGARQSEIASRMKGEAVVRPAELVYVGTSSLYRAGSSQYNRLVIPRGSLGPSQSEVRWSRLGETRGFGTLHISRATLQALEEATEPTNSNHAFGEGASIKFRTIRHALDKLFEPGQREITEEITRHSMSRIVYGAFLARNGREFLSGRGSRPDYYFGEETGIAGSDSIAAFWIKRWLSNRVSQPKILARVASFDAESVRLSAQLPKEQDQDFMPIKDIRDTSASFGSHDGGGWLDFVRGLYRGSSGQADRTESVDLARLHVKTRLDDAIIEALDQGKSVILTGNPGDGKTHLLRVLEPSLQTLAVPPLVELDASAITDVQLVERWQTSIDAGKPFAAAINQAVLFNLADRFPEFGPLSSAVQQVDKAITYSGAASEESSTVVFDLSRRNMLSAEVVAAVIARVTDETLFGRCGSCPIHSCDVIRNARLLGAPIFQQRLTELFEIVTAQGHHATVRELQGFVSYLLFGGRDCHRVLVEGGLREFEPAQLAFSGKGRLFDLLRTSCDPSSTSHPVWDERLINGPLASDGWAEGAELDTGSFEPDNLPRFTSRKRSFYFFHSDGGACLALNDSDERSFLDFLRTSDKDTIRTLLKKINRLFGDPDESDAVWAWQSHRFDQSPRRIVYATTKVLRNRFEVVRPSLSPTMLKGFDYAIDHVLLRLKGEHSKALKVDFEIYRILNQAERGVPLLSLPTTAMRRLWQFLEQIDEPFGGRDSDDVVVRLRDLTTSKAMEVNLDVEARRLLEVVTMGVEVAH